MAWNPLIGKGEQWPHYMGALLKALGDMPEGAFRRYAEGQQQAYVSLHLQERPKGIKPIEVFEIPLDGKRPDKLARDAVKREFPKHPFFSEPVRRSPIPYGTEPDTLVIEVYPVAA